MLSVSLKLGHWARLDIFPLYNIHYIPVLFTFHLIFTPSHSFFFPCTSFSIITCKAWPQWGLLFMIRVWLKRRNVQGGWASRTANGGYRGQLLIYLKVHYFISILTATATDESIAGCNAFRCSMKRCSTKWCWARKHRSRHVVFGVIKGYSLEGKASIGAMFYDAVLRSVAKRGIVL